MAMAGFCGSVKYLSQEEIQKMIETLEKPEDFIKDGKLREMFRLKSLGSSEENAIKYLNVVERSLRFQATPQQLVDEAEDFVMDLEPKFEDEYEQFKNITDPDELNLQRRQFLERVQSEYTRKLGREKRYRSLKEMLNDAYRGKIKIERNP